MNAKTATPALWLRRAKPASANAPGNFAPGPAGVALYCDAMTRRTVAVTFQGAPGTRYVAHGTTYKPRDHDASIRFKRARWKSYEMMRLRPSRQ